MNLLEYLELVHSPDYSALRTEKEIFRIWLLNWHFNHPIRNGSYMVHVHRDYELLIPKSNVYRCRVDDIPLTVGKGEFLLLQPGQSHSDDFEIGSDFYGFCFELTEPDSGLPLILFASGLPPEKQIAAISAPESVETLNSLLRTETETGEAVNCGPLYRAVLEIVLSKVLCAYPEGILRPEIRHPDANGGERYARVFRAFGKFLRQNPTLDNLAQECAMSKSALNNFCQSHFSLPPLRAFMKFKLANAKKILEENPTMSAKEVAGLFGFANQFHFSRLYRNCFGTPPKGPMRTSR